MVQPILEKGDYVSFHRPLIHRFSVLSAPGLVPETYSFELLGRLISVVADPGASINQVAGLLAAQVSREFAHSVRAQQDLGEVVLTGTWTTVSGALGILTPTGQDFDAVNFSPNLQLALLPDQPGLRGQVGTCRVLRTLPIASKRGGELIETQQVWLREIDSSKQFQAWAEDVPTLVALASVLL
jgi:hypothetical protein